VGARTLGMECPVHTHSLDTLGTFDIQSEFELIGFVCGGSNVVHRGKKWIVIGKR